MLNLKQKLVSWLLRGVHLEEVHIGGRSVVISDTGIAMGNTKISGLGAPTVQDDALRKGRAEITKDEIAAAAGILLSQLESAVCSETEVPDIVKANVEVGDLKTPTKDQSIFTHKLEITSEKCSIFLF